MPFGTQVDALLDTLGSGTSEEVETALQSYSMRDIVGVLAQRLLDVEESGGGGGGITSLTATVTTDPNTFVGSHVFDLGAFGSLISITETVLALTPDGETFGTSPGDLLVQINVSFSPNNVTFGVPSAGWFPSSSDDILTAVSGTAAYYGRMRYVKVELVISDDNFTPYAGANHPTAQVRIDLDYL